MSAVSFNMPTFRTDDLLLHYDDVGQGAPVLFLQGVGITRHAWAPQVRALSAAYRCVAVDHRGIGGSREALGACPGYL